MVNGINRVSGADALSPKLEPLKCGACGAPAALRLGESTRCAHCAANVPIPAAYRALHQAGLERTKTDVVARNLALRMGRAPNLVLRFLAGAFSPLALAVGMFPGSFLLAFAPVMGLALLVGPYVHANYFDVVPEYQQLWTAVATGLVIAWAGTLFGVRGTRRALSLGPLQAALAARPATSAPNIATCRNCGAALTIAHGALHARCDYCETESLVALPAAWVARMTSSDLHVGLALVDGLAAWEGELSRLRSRSLVMVAGLVVASALMLAGFASSIEVDAFDPRVKPRSFAAHVRARPRTLLERHHVKHGEFEYLEDAVHDLDAGCPSADESIPLTPGPSACEDGCEASVYVAMARGERFTMTSSAFAPGSRVAVFEHRGYAWDADDPWLPSPTPFGPRVAHAHLSNARAFSFRANASAWHHVVLHVRGARTGEPVLVCASVN